ncbi:DUF397 domain-containing protein [Saccharothrix luteola]|uniref:DUF397 domain-containing protein n=1 Tax=Saccharothrix luteola TaxID=2893018 RepID=UPI001E6010CC|nr:DUF397 domain-containing protein [Saccharothrix luteola]MCC8247454.1 DUF397 domain-containing protein [Saccharothrix luteola]
MKKRLVRDGRVFVTSSASNTGSSCVGVSVGVQQAGVLDTKNPGGDVLEFSRGAFASFLGSLKSS